MSLELSEATIKSIKPRNGIPPGMASIEISFSDIENDRFPTCKLVFSIDLHTDQTLQQIWKQAASETHKLLGDMYRLREDIKNKISHPES